MNTPIPRWLICLTAVVYFFLHLPILVLVVFSFNDSKFSVDWRGFTLQWYQRLWERPDILRGLKASLIVGAAATVISAVLGTLVALALARPRFRGRRAFEGFLYVPIVTPEIVTGISLLLLFALLKFPLGLTTFWKITVPQLWPGILSGALLAFTISFDDFVIASFVSGPGSSTLPIVVYGMVRKNVEPSINAISTIILFGTATLIYLADRLATAK
jgi:spermidine/putrescine transport system permease protein